MVIPVECHKTSSCRLKERWCLHFVAVDHLIVRMGRKTTAKRAMFCAHRGVNVYGEVTWKEIKTRITSKIFHVPLNKQATTCHIKQYVHRRCLVITWKMEAQATSSTASCSNICFVQGALSHHLLLIFEKKHKIFIYFVVFLTFRQEKPCSTWKNRHIQRHPVSKWMLKSDW